jgi:hypothetical protein
MQGILGQNAQYVFVHMFVKKSYVLMFLSVGEYYIIGIYILRLNMLVTGVVHACVHQKLVKCNKITNFN